MSTKTTAEKTATKVKFKPLGNRVLVKRLEAEKTLKGGIILPDNAKQKQEQAQVLAIGTGKKDKDGKDIPISLKVGDIIIIDKYAGQEITLNDEQLIIVRADDIIAKIEK